MGGWAGGREDELRDGRGGISEMMGSGMDGDRLRGGTQMVSVC